MMPEYTIKEYASRERVTERTVRNWMAKGAIQFRRVGEGHGRGVRIIVPSRSRMTVFSVNDEEESGSKQK